MVESILNKLFLTLLFLSILNVIRHGWKIFMTVRNSEIPNKYEFSKSELIFMGLSISYIVTTIFTGIKL